MHLASLALAGAALAAAALQNILYACGAGLQAWLFPAAGALAFAALYLRSWLRRTSPAPAIWCVLLLALCLLLTRYTFSHPAFDWTWYHFPMQDLLREGWNPVRQATPEAFDAFIASRPDIAATQFLHDHVLYLPKFVALAGALVGAASGLLAADAFLQWVWVFVLAATAYRFARRFYAPIPDSTGLTESGQDEQNHSVNSNSNSVNPVESGLFALALAVTPKLPYLISGFVDYTVYTTLLTLLLSTALYLRTASRRDLAAAAIAFATAAATKQNALAVCCVFALCLAPIAIRRWRRRRCSTAPDSTGLTESGQNEQNHSVNPSFNSVNPVESGLFVGLAAAFIAVAASLNPLVTSAIHFKSPLYPSISFSADHPPIDITLLHPNADGLALTLPERFAYAWVSPSATLKFAAAIRGRDALSPDFGAAESGMDGDGAPFRILLLASALALAFSRKNAVTKEARLQPRTGVFAICCFIFATGALSPTSLVGYPRYFPQMWAIPTLAFFNLYATRKRLISQDSQNPNGNLQNPDSSNSVNFAKHSVNPVKFLALLPVAAVLGFAILRTLTAVGFSWRCEAALQNSLAALADSPRPLAFAQPPPLTLARRICRSALCQPATSFCAARESARKSGNPAINQPDTHLLYWSLPFAVFAPTQAEADRAAAELCERYSPANSPARLLSYPWRTALIPPPSAR